ncbi:MAG: CpsD/CapB family tyrosine-protein kinase [Bryobacteraceae bacterium]
MSRVHDALRRASQDRSVPSRQSRSDRFQPRAEEPVTTTAQVETPNYPPPPPPPPPVHAPVPARFGSEVDPAREDMEVVIHAAHKIPYNPQKDALVVNIMQPREAPAEEFRTLRTRLNHLQSSQPLHTLVITSASPAEGKSFTAANLAISQAQLAGKRVLLADFDFRRPTVNSTFQIPGQLGLTDYLTGKASLGEILYQIADTNLFILPAGGAVPNPLELLNLSQCRTLIDDLRNHFDWVILDSPPLLFAADGNLLSTMCDGTILVVRIGTTTFDSVTRAMQSLCENNVLGVVVNGARRGELYSKYSYYHDYYAPESGPDSSVPEGEVIETEVAPVNSK